MQFDFSSIGSTIVYLNSFGIYGPLVAFILFFLQAAVPVIPYIIVAGAAGIIFGNVLGFCLAWVGALAGACFLFWISKLLGGNIFINKIKNRYEFDLSKLNNKNVFWALLMSRIFPVVPTTIINVGSGLGGVSFNTFFLSSALGKLPWAIIYVVLGNYLIKSQNLINTIIIVSMILLVSIVGVYYYRDKLPFKRKYAK